jgi:hypothetical protein
VNKNGNTCGFTGYKTLMEAQNNASYSPHGTDVGPRQGNISAKKVKKIHKRKVASNPANNLEVGI